MKKLLISFAGLILTVFVCISLAPWAVPQSENLAVLCESGNAVWAVENRSVSSCIYKIQNNTIKKLYICSRVEDNAMAVVSAVACKDGLPYIVREIPDNGIWQLLSPNENGRLALAATLPYESGLTVLDIAFEKDRSFLTVSDAEGSIKVLTSDNGMKSWSVLLIQPAPDTGSVERALYRNGTLYISLSGGQALSVSATGAKTIASYDIPEISKISSVKTPFSILLESKLSIYLAALVILAGIFIPLFIILIAMRRAKSFAARTTITIVGGLTVFFFIACCLIAYLSYLKLPLAYLPGLMSKLFICLAAFIAVCAVITALLLRNITKSIRILSNQMSAVADGNFSAKGIGERRDEIGKMSRSLQELCVSLSIRDYEVGSTMRSYHRFVPCGLEQLLDRASVMEVNLGDSRAINGSAGIITVCNRRQVRSMLDDDDYVSFVNQTSSFMDSAIRTHDGLLLSSGYSMEGNKVYYRAGSGCGVKSALDIIGLTNAAPSTETHPNPQFFILLHKTVFLYGIAGSEDNMFPYLSSSELEFLGSYADSLRSAGVQIVMTEQYMQKLDSRHATRYIGFVASDDDQSGFKLYEVLDPYSDIERNLRINYDAQLQEAIMMFYKSDFYLARNLFSAILRICPSDGIARWYLFACEYFFHSTDGIEPNFQLFGVDLG